MDHRIIKSLCKYWRPAACSLWRISLVIFLFHWLWQIDQSRYKYQHWVRYQSCIQNAIHPRSIDHCDDLGVIASRCIFRLIPVVPTMAHIFGRWWDPARPHSTALLNHYPHPLCFHGDSPRHRSAKSVKLFSWYFCYWYPHIYHNNWCTWSKNRIIDGLNSPVDYRNVIINYNRWRPGL